MTNLEKYTIKQGKAVGTIYHNGLCHCAMVAWDGRQSWTDYPIVYTANGTAHWNRPEILPQYVKRIGTKLARLAYTLNNEAQPSISPMDTL